ncbi:MAG: hypothetical protein IJH41_06045 [Eubacterium sp.]|nr:hypothetical protein [Eubacterium sp.]
MRNKRKKHHSLLAVFLAAALAGTCVIAGCSAMKTGSVEKITGKDTAKQIQKIKEKAGKAADKTGDAAKKVKKLTDKAIEKAGGKEEIARKVKSILAKFAKNKSRIKSADDIELTAVDNTDTVFRFTYGGEKYRAAYSYGFDTWTIYDSYKITNEHDMKIICQALIDIHPVHGSDLKSYRTAEDMAYEWQQHNIVYELLPDSNTWKSSAKDVDLDPYDQGKSYKEIYEDRTGREFDLKDFV